MFGEKLMFGQSTKMIDPKGRLRLSPSTNREKGDVVYLVYDSHINEYKIVPSAVIEAEFKKYQNLIDAAESTKSLKSAKILLNDFVSSIIQVCSVDEQGRILLSKNFPKDEEINVIGAGNHLILKKINKKQ